MPSISERPFYPHRSSIFLFGRKIEFAGLRINSFINRHWALHPNIQVLAETLGEFDEDLGGDPAAPWIRQSLRKTSFSIASSSLSSLSDAEVFDLDTPEFQSLAIETAKVQVHKLIPMRDVKCVDSPIITFNLEKTQHDVCRIFRSNSLSLSTTSWDGLIDEHSFPNSPDAFIEGTRLKETSNRNSPCEGSQSDNSTPVRIAALISEDDRIISLNAALSIPPRLSSLTCDRSVARRREIWDVLLPDHGHRSAACSAELHHRPFWNMDIRTANTSTESLHDGEYHDLHDMFLSDDDDVTLTQDYVGSDTVSSDGKGRSYLCHVGKRSTKLGLKYHVRRWWMRVSPLADQQLE